MRTSAELRAGFRAFFESKGHVFRPSAPLVPRADDRSTLLTTAGMQPQMPFFLGRESPPALLTTTAQKCFRTPDIDEVGLDTYHLTFFEMLGNFSFGQYFKEGAIDFAWEFVFEHLQLDPEPEGPEALRERRAAEVAQHRGGAQTMRLATPISPKVAISRLLELAGFWECRGFLFRSL